MGEVNSKRCHHCSGPTRDCGNADGLKFITSDCRPLDVVAKIVMCESCGLVQKEITQDWSEQVRNIYETYDMSVSHPTPRRISGQDGNGTFRVDQFASTIVGHLTDSEDVRLLDVGTGNGDLLRSLSSLLSNVRMDVLETSDHHQDLILGIDGVDNFFLGMDQIAKTYDVISLSHVLEHVVHPTQFLLDLKRLLKPNGVLAIQLPNYVVNCIDIVVFDHASHFEPQTLKQVLGSAGFEIQRMELTNGGREISCIAGASSSCMFESIVHRSQSNLEHCLSVLQEFSAGLAKLKSKTHYVFGAGNGGSWVYSQCLGAVDGFVEDDVSRIGGEFLGKPVIGRQDIAKDCALSIPVFGKRASHILASLQPTPTISLVPRNELEHDGTIEC